LKEVTYSGVVEDTITLAMPVLSSKLIALFSLSYLSIELSKRDDWMLSTRGGSSCEIGDTADIFYLYFIW